MEGIVDDIPCIYFSLREDGTLLNFNKRLCKRLEYTEPELAKQKIDFIFTVSTRIFHQTHFFPLLKMQGYADEIFITLRKKDGSPLPVLINAERITYNGDYAYQYAGIVVNNRNKFEEELIEARKAAEKALSENSDLLQAKAEMQQYVEDLDKQIKVINKQNEELKQFSRVVSHNLQEPLRKLAVFVGLFNEARDSHDQQKLTDKIIRANAQMKSVVTGLQQYIWLSDAPLKFDRINIEKILADVEPQLAEEHPGVHLAIDLPETFVIEADWDQMRLLFYELLANAIRFRKEENAAAVSISADQIQRNVFQSVPNKYKYVDFLQLRIRDTGLGFNPEFKSQTFELFKTLHTESGRGIGLSLCSKVVNNHNGKINIDSRPGEWTLITIYLPLNAGNFTELAQINETTDLSHLHNKE